MVDPGRVERPVRTGQNAGPDLDDPGLGRQDDVVAHEVAREDRRRLRVARGRRRVGDGCMSGSLFGVKCDVPELQLR